MLRTETSGPITRIEMARTIFGRPLYRVSAFLVDRLLIDTGCPATARELLAFCSEQRIRRIVNTHHHEDHVGGNRLLQRKLALPVFAPRASLPYLEQAPRIPFYRRLVWGQPSPSTAAPLGESVRAGRYRFRVVPTPGHAPDHVCLFEPHERWLFTGDLYVHPRIRYLRRVDDAWAQIRSLRKVLALEPELLICSHAGLVDNAQDALRERIEWWERLADEAGRLSESGCSARAITRRLLGREGLMTFLSGGEFSKRNLICSLLNGGAGHATT